MAELHGLVARLALALTVVAAAWGIGLVAFRRAPGAMLYGELVWVFLAIGVTGVLGLVMVATAGLPDDPLHIVYGLLAAGALPLTFIVGRDRPTGQRGIVVAIAAIVLLILVVRLFQTAG